MEPAEQRYTTSKVVLLVLGIFVFLAIMVMTYNIGMRNSPDIVKGCIHKNVLEPIGAEDAFASSSAMKSAIERKIGENVTFNETRIDSCGASIAYVYTAASDSNETYIACEDGKIYRSKDICAKNNETIGQSLRQIINEHI